MFVVQIEGNIGIGKSTFIEFVKDKLKKSEKTTINVKFIDESVLDWINTEGYNLLDLYYNDPKKYGELFQFNVFITTLRKCLKENYENNNTVDIIFMERSLYTSIHCFNKLLLDEKLVDPMTHTILKNALQLFDDKILKPNIIIYFEIDNKDIPFLLQNRILKRKRRGESNISIDYLTKLNDVYNNVMNSEKNTKIFRYKFIPNNLNVTTFNDETIKDFSEIFSDIMLSYHSYKTRARHHPQ